jgi:hypothetical protein
MRRTLFETALLVSELTGFVANTMKTASRGNPHYWASVPGTRAHVAAGRNGSRSITWAGKQEKLRPREKCFFLTFPSYRTYRSWLRARRSLRETAPALLGRRWKNDQLKRGVPRQRVNLESETTSRTPSVLNDSRNDGERDAHRPQGIVTLVRGQLARTRPDESTSRMPRALDSQLCRNIISPRAPAR